MITVCLFLIELLLRGIFLGVLTVGLAFCAWLLWDITVGPSAREASARARAARRRAAVRPGGA